VNPRILKKLCKRAAPLLAVLGDRRDQFKVVEPGDVSWCFTGFDRRSYTRPRSLRAINPAVEGDWIVPKRGTIAVGGMSGYEEPEWDDEPAFFALVGLVYWETVGDPDSQDDVSRMRAAERGLGSPAGVFKLAAEMVSRGDEWPRMH